MRTGRPPKSTEQHIAEGTLDASRHRTTPLVVGGRTVPEPPRKDAVFRKVWDEVIDHLAPILDRADWALVESMVLRLMEAREAEEHVRKHGLILELERTGRDGTSWTQPYENPAATTARKARIEIRQLCDRMGIGPSARARLGNAGMEGRSASEDLDGLADVINLRAVEG